MSKCLATSRFTLQSLEMPHRAVPNKLRGANSRCALSVGLVMGFY